jgi:hypothetical protein
VSQAQTTAMNQQTTLDKNNVIVTTVVLEVYFDILILKKVMNHYAYTKRK